MKREEFLKSFVAIAGSFVIVSCSKSIIDSHEENVLADISIEEAEKWFNNTYLPEYSSSRTSTTEKEYKRKAGWEKATKNKDNRNQDFVWVPIDYEDNDYPLILSWTEDTLYRKALNRYFVQPVFEGLVVFKINGKKKAMLSQIAFDPYQVMASGFKIKKDKFTGMLLNANWDDSILNGITYKKGVEVNRFESGIEPDNARSKCDLVWITSTRAEVINGEFTIIGHGEYKFLCSSGGGSFGGAGAGGDYSSPGFGNTNGGNGSGGNSGGGGRDVGATRGDTITAIVRPFNVIQALTIPTSFARQQFNMNLKNALEVTGLSVNMLGWSFDKADALAKVVGGNVDDFFPLASAAGKWIGVTGVVIDGYQLYIGYAENGWQWNQDGWNLAQVTLGVTGIVAATVFAAPWIAVGTGAISLGIYVKGKIK